MGPESSEGKLLAVFMQNKTFRKYGEVFGINHYVTAMGVSRC